MELIELTKPMRTRPDHYWRHPDWDFDSDEAYVADNEDCSFTVALWRGRRWQVLGGYGDRPPSITSLVELLPDGSYGWYEDVDESELDYVCHRWHRGKLLDALRDL